MNQDHSLSHSERLRNRGALRRLFESGRSGFVYPIRYMWFAEEAGGDQTDGDQAQANEGELLTTSAEVMFSVPKRLHKRANKRNLLRRRTKEAYRLNKDILLSTQGDARAIDIALIYSTKELHNYKTINNAVIKILTTIAKEL